MAILRGAVSAVAAETSPNGELYVKELESDTFLGTYQCELIGTIVAAAHSVNSGGFFWAINPSTSNKVAKIELICFELGITTAVAAGFPTAPRLALSKFTFFGTPSGAVVPVAGTGATQGKFDSQYPAPILDWRSAITGLTCTYLQALLSAMAPATAVVGSVATSQIQGATHHHAYQPREDAYEQVIRPGEGVVLWQPDAGSTSDTRKFCCRVFWEEIIEG